MVYLTTEELAGRIKYDVRTIRERMMDSVLLEGRHYFRPFGGRKILFLWENIEEDMRGDVGYAGSDFEIPMANGRSCQVRARESRTKSAATPHLEATHG